MPSQEEKYPFWQVVTVAFGHFVHDTFSAFLSPLLPWLIDKFALSYTAAGGLVAFLQAPSILNPFIGYLGDRISLQYLIALAPALTATGMSLMGVMPGYGALAAILLLTGFSVAAFHSSAPAILAHLAPKRTGKSMGLFMAGGELGRVVGPMLAVWVVALWGLQGMPRLLALGWGTSLILLWQVRKISVRIEPKPLSDLWPVLKRIALPLSMLVLGRSFLLGAFGAFLPTFLSHSGFTKVQSGLVFALLYELPGVVGALAVGSLSDRIGRLPTVVGAVLISAGAAGAFLLSPPGTASLVWLPFFGFSALSLQPVFMALVQDHAPMHRSTANGAYLALSFVSRPVAVMAVGAIADSWGLKNAFGVSVFLPVLALAALPMLKPPSE